MFAILNPIKKTSVATIKHIKLSSDNPYVAFYY